MRTPVLSLILLFLAFGSVQGATIDLADCLELAREHNPVLRSARLSPEVAGEEIARARGAELPQIDLSGGYTVLKDSQAFSIEGRSVPTEDRKYAFASLALEQNLYDFGRIDSRVERARARQQASRYDYEEREQDVFLRTVAIYYRILEAEKLLQAAEEEVRQTEDHRRVARALFDQGVVTRNDVLQAEVALAASRQLFLARRNELENGWLRLNHLTGRPAGARGELEDPRLAALPEAAEPAEAVANRPELRAQLQLVAESRQAVRASRSTFRPSFYARAGIDYVENSQVEEQTIYSATVGFRMNLFDGLASTAQLRQATIEQARQERSLDNLRAEARLEYRTALNDARVARQRIETAREAIRQGEENLRINQNRYREQVGTATEALDAQTLLTRARTDYSRAVFDYQVSLARVRRAKGAL